ncbi:MAG: pro-sigmaK processing inhibitor BofA family protein [Thermoanaerobacterales bacterium]|nr:pro-sigmaK processing inhibitor BofA family protein [Bacillota bacterium]MDI6906991.1 pro-sigmaK processing inhibitor BofA family protein [Thermoanaerobacterales bacterium]
MEWKTILLGLLGLAGLYLVGSFFVTPVKYLGRLLGYAIVGTVLLVLTNLAGTLFGLHIAVNAVTIFTAGLLQIPGVVLLILAKVLLL